MAKMTFSVTNIGGGPGNAISVSFTLDAEGETSPGKRTVANFNLSFPREIGKEFEVDDTYSLEIVPKPEGQH
jgi:hypothetical protein